MIPNRRAQEELYRIGRHIDNQVKTGTPFDQAVENIRALDAASSAKVKVLEDLLKGKQTESPLISPYASQCLETLAKLFARLRGHDIESSRSIGALEASMRITNDTSSKAFGSLRGLVTYVLVILSLVAVCSTIYVVKVLPQFEELFESFGAELPFFTRLMISVAEGMSIWWVPLLLVFGFLFYQFFRLISSLSALEPLSKAAHYLPGISRLKKLHLKLLVVSYTHVLIKGGLPPQVAFIEALNLATGHEPNGDPDVGLRLAAENGLMDDLLIAHQLNALEPEVEREIDEISLAYLDELSGLRERFQLSLQLFVAILVGALVIAMYLPIFQMGQVV